MDNFGFRSPGSRQLTMFSDDDLIRLLSYPQAKRSLSAANAKTSAAQHHNLHLRQVSKAWEAIYWIEVPLRNRIHEAFVDNFGQKWWTSEVFRQCVGGDLASEANGSRSSSNPDKIFLDDLTLGFWVKCLASNQDQRTWVRFLHRYFIEGTSRKELHRNLVRFKSHRNVIAHHGPATQIELAETFEIAVAIGATLDPKLRAHLEQISKRREA